MHSQFVTVHLADEMALYQREWVDPDKVKSLCVGLQKTQAGCPLCKYE